MSKRSFTILDLFSGAGGMTRGFVDEGFRTVGAVEIEPSAAATYGANFGQKHLYAGSIESFLAEESIPRADVVVGGPPCQGFSNLGRRDPVDPRNRLWRRHAEVVQIAQPSAFVVENVDAFYKSDQLKSLRWQCRKGGLLDGYRIAFAKKLNAADFGVPQKRIRCIVIGVRIDLPDPIVEPTHDRSSWVSTGDVFDCLSHGTNGVDLPDDRVATINLKDGRNLSVPGPFHMSEIHLGRRPTKESLARYRAIPPGGNWTDLGQHLRPPCWQRKSSGTTDVMGRLRVAEPSVTVRTEFYKPEKGRYLHPVADRPITHAEAATLQGFDSRHLWCGSKVQIARQIGNAVPPALAAAVARSIRGIL